MSAAVENKKSHAPAAHHKGASDKMSAARDEVKKAEVPAAGEMSHVNHVRTVFAQAGRIGKMGWAQLQKLEQNHRIVVGIVALLCLILPLFIFSMMVPWVLAAVIAVYSYLFTFPVLIRDLEEAIISETPISEAHAKHVKDVSLKVQENWVLGRKYLFQGSLKAIELAQQAIALSIKLANQAMDKMNKQKPAAAAATKKD